MPSPFIGFTRPGGVADGNPPVAVALRDAHREAPRTRPFEVGAEVPRIADEGAVAVLQPVEVELLEALHRRQGADADVHGAVAGREHPPVARHRRSGLVAQREARLEVVLGVTGRLGVGADRQTERLVGIAVGPEQLGDRPRSAGGDDRERSPVLTTVGDGADHPVALEHGHGVVLPQDLGAGLFGELHQACIEPSPRPHGAVRGKRRDARPVELADRGVGDHAQPVDAVRVGEVDAEFVERFDRPRGEAVATDLVAPVNALFEERDRRTTTGGADRGGGTGRPTADDEDVSLSRAFTHGANPCSPCRGWLNQVDVGDDVHQRRPVVLESAPERVVELVAALDADAEAAAQLGVGGEVGVVEDGLPDVQLAGALLLA